jgi:hypothetical protein
VLPAGSNLGWLGADNKLDTRSKLVEFLTTNIYLV